MYAMRILADRPACILQAYTQANLRIFILCADGLFIFILCADGQITYAVHG